GSSSRMLCQQGLQFFPERISALREMRRALKRNGRAAIAVWAEIDRNQIFAAYYAALRATVPAELANLITAPFSWPSGAGLMDAAKEPVLATFVYLPPRYRWCWRKVWSRPFGRFLPHLFRQALLRFRRTCKMHSSHGCGATPLLRDGKVVGE